MVAAIAQTIGLTLASAVAGILLCAVLWLAFRLVRHHSPVHKEPVVEVRMQNDAGEVNKHLFKLSVLALIAN